MDSAPADAGLPADLASFGVDGALPGGEFGVELVEVTDAAVAGSVAETAQRLLSLKIELNPA